MEGGRRKFLKLAGLGGAGLVGATLLPMGGRSLLSASDGTRTTGAGGTGRRWGMVIDTRRCIAKDGCEDCKIACHTSHNVPEIASPQHEIKWIWKEPFDRVFSEEAHEFARPDLLTRPVMVLCNHCENPPCVRVCPPKATWKREDGVVMIDWHRCVGCRYCLVACPYGARSFNWRDPRDFLTGRVDSFPTRMKGVVEKCNFCEELIAANPANPRPACVAACKQNAIFFGDLNDPSSSVRRILSMVQTMRRRAVLGTGPKVFYIV
ncbi:MAG: 4Fe-4S dicluster domain-containing protein [Pseudomonadota bacterium]